MTRYEKYDVCSKYPLDDV